MRNGLSLALAAMALGCGQGPSPPAPGKLEPVSKDSNGALPPPLVPTLGSLAEFSEEWSELGHGLLGTSEKGTEVWVGLTEDSDALRLLVKPAPRDTGGS